MRLARLALVPTAALLVVACSTGGATSAPASPSATAPATRIDVKLTDNLRMEPASMRVPAECRLPSS